MGGYLEADGPEGLEDRFALRNFYFSYPGSFLGEGPGFVLHWTPIG